jgi:proline iminopeptidase
MSTKTILITVLSLAILAAAGIALWLRSLGRPMYEPGDLAKSGAAGKRNLKPAGAIEYGPVRRDGALPFSLALPDGIRLSGFARGSGKPVLVIHGGPGFPFASPPAGLAPFESSRRFYYWDQRGSGASTRPIDRFASRDFGRNAALLESRLGMAEQLADIERLRAALGAERIDLVGHSFGGLLATLYAAEFPERTGSILLVAPAPLIAFPAPSGGLYAETRKALPVSERPAYDRWLKDFFDYGKLFSRSEAEMASLNAAFIPFYAKAAAARGTPHESIAGTDPGSIGGWMMQALFFSLGKRHDWSAALARIRSPAALAYGSRDLSEAGSFEQYRAIPGIRFVPVEGGDHFILDDRGLFARAAAGLLD